MINILCTPVRLCDIHFGLVSGDNFGCEDENIEERGPPNIGGDF